MPENLTTDPNVAPVKRYAPPNQRNRGLGRRKSGGDRLERANSYTGDGDKTQAGFPRDINSNYCVGEFSSVALIPLNGCRNSEAVQLLNDRWAAAMNALNSLPDNSPEKPVLYSTSGVSSPWGHAILPHLMMQPAGLKKDFLSELRQAIRNTNASSDT